MINEPDRNGSNFLPRHESMKALATSYALLFIDDIKLLLAQSDIRNLGSVFEIDRREPPPKGTGWIKYQNANHPVYSLSKDLAVLPSWPESRRVCVLLVNDTGFFGVLVDEIEILGQQQLVCSSLPDCMLLPNTPITAITLFRDDIVCMTSALDIATYLGVGMNSKKQPSILLSQEHEYARA